MAVIAVANAKGGSGKTTTVALLATELARSGAEVVVLDCDPLGLAADWASRCGPDSRITAVTDITPGTLADHLRRLNRPDRHIIADLSAARDTLMAMALGLCDLALIPVQGSALDARGAIQVLELIQCIEANARAHINRAIVLSRVNPLVATRSLRTVRDLLLLRGMAMIETPVVERGAFREMFERSGTLYTLDAGQVRNLDRAQANMQALARDVMARIERGGRDAHGPFAQLCYQHGIATDEPCANDDEPSRQRVKGA
ncbi:ParA family protein [Mycoplana sp. MJR14]|jgi:chromosome partitioning protein|uniref:ParA family protein n=1 Tax=Mycoplana sp. MJR14 TaxID=3032583 RepID=UPI0013AF6FF6|nr:ParA family protein [Mycoplana sp. MJR14]MDF1634527.1 ParA family protein [Mycoplana sp. MJR14]